MTDKAYTILNRQLTRDKLTVYTILLNMKRDPHRSPLRKSLQRGVGRMIRTMIIMEDSEETWVEPGDIVYWVNFREMIKGQGDELERYHQYIHTFRDVLETMKFEFGEQA